MRSTVIRKSTDAGAGLYLKRLGRREVIDFAALEADGRIRPTYDANDWTPGDYTFAEDTQALYLTGTGEMLWQAAHMESEAQFSDEAETCAECLAEGFRIEHGTIRNPGKFEAEPLAAYHAYHVMLEGFSDDDDGPTWRVGNVVCEETEQGFVNSEIYDTEADAIKAWEAASRETRCLECGDLQERDDDGAFCIKCQPSAEEMARGAAS